MSGELVVTPDELETLAVATPADTADVLEIFEFARERHLDLRATPSPTDAGAIGVTMRHRTLEGMSGREREVMALLTLGCSNAAIGKRLFLSVKTVEKHLNSIYLKLGLQPEADVHRRVLAAIFFLAESKAS